MLWTGGERNGVPQRRQHQRQQDTSGLHFRHFSPGSPGEEQCCSSHRHRPITAASTSSPLPVQVETHPLSLTMRHTVSASRDCLLSLPTLLKWAAPVKASASSILLRCTRLSVFDFGVIIIGSFCIVLFSGVRKKNRRQHVEYCT